MFGTGFWSPAFTFDGVSTLVLVLVVFVGSIVAQYSIRYLDGERSRGRYFIWFGWTVASVILMVLSGNLLWTAIGWMSTSFGLHHLLTHYADRRTAIRAAWTKFCISRIGDAALIAALFLIWDHYQSLHLEVLFDEMERGNIAESINPIGFLLVIAAMTKSALFPFHAWLPETLETPTPVSALMHAGIVNAGGFLIIRTSPLMVHASGAMVMLAIVGGVTACFAALVMLTQPSIKKQLAYSTIAQMGLMMLQCGLGAFSAVMLHLIAHSLYKAHAFLSSGSVIAEQSGLRTIQLTKTPENLPTKVPVFWAAVISLVCFASVSWAVQTALDLPTNPIGAWILGGLMVLALSRWLSAMLTIAKREPSARVRLISISILGTFAMCLSYRLMYWLVCIVTMPSLPTIAPMQSPNWMIGAWLISIGFLGLFMVENRAIRSLVTHRLASLHVHASNGFYFPAFLRAVNRSLQT